VRADRAAREGEAERPRAMLEELSAIRSLLTAQVLLLRQQVLGDPVDRALVGDLVTSARPAYTTQQPGWDVLGRQLERLVGLAFPCVFYLVAYL